MKPIKLSISTKLVAFIAIAELLIMLVFSKLETLKQFPLLEAFLDTIILGIIVSWGLRFLLAKPLQKIFQAMQQVGGKDLDVALEFKQKDEMGRLANDFNQMVFSLKMAEEERNEEHRELTKANQELKEAQQKLIQSAKMAAVGQLAGGVAHEINNPLTGVLNNIQLIKMEVEAKKEFNLSEFKEILDVVEESALRCKRITQGLLDFSRAGKRPHQPTNINEAIEATLILAEREIRIENIKLIRELSNEPLLVLADSHQLQQVFLDIINNAKWAMQEKKQGELRIKTQIDPERKSVMISFSDTGCGILPENLSHIFEPFFTTKKLGEGTGLGLSISYGIIKEHNGTIAVESEGRDKGAAFRITLPAIT